MPFSSFFIILLCLPILKSALLKSANGSNQNCHFAGKEWSNGQHWIHQDFFNVTCINGHIQVTNCVTEKGTRLPLGTAKHVEEGVGYSCKLNFGGEEGAVTEEAATSADQEETQHVTECDFLPGNGRAEYVRGGYAVSCHSNQILGCIDAFGDLAGSGQFFVLSRGQLRRCVVYANGRWAKSEPKGCFNGSREDDPADPRFRVSKGRVWRNGQFELRCGEEGIQVYKCLVEQRRIHVGTAWVDHENVLNVCQ